jgi:hypothetical protein
MTAHELQVKLKVKRLSAHLAIALIIFKFFSREIEWEPPSVSNS